MTKAESTSGSPWIQGKNLDALLSTPPAVLRKDPDGLTRLVEAVRSSDPAMRATCLTVLDAVACRPPPGRWLEEHLATFCAWLQVEKDLPARLLAARLLKHVERDALTQSKAECLRDALIEGLLASDADLVRTCHRALGPDDLPDPLTDKLAALFESSVEPARWAAVDLFRERTADPRVRRGYQRALADADPEYRWRAAQRTGFDARGQSPLIDAPDDCLAVWAEGLDAQDPTIRQQAACVLSHSKDGEHLDRIVRLARTDPISHVRTEALEAIETMGLGAEVLWEVATGTLGAWTSDRVGDWGCEYEMFLATSILMRVDASHERVSTFLLQHVKKSGAFAAKAVVDALAELRVPEAASLFVELARSRADGGTGIDPVTGLSCAYCGNEATGRAVARIHEVGFVPFDAIDTWIELLEDVNSDALHPDAAMALARMAPGLSRARKAVIRAMLNGTPAAPSRMVEALAVFDHWDRGALLAVLRCLEDGIGIDRQAVCRVLRRQVAQDAEGVATLRTLSDEGVSRASEALAIAGVPTPDGLERLVRQLAAADLRTDALGMLRRWAGSTTALRTALTRQLFDEGADAATRMAALDVLSAGDPSLREPSVANAFELACRTPDVTLRRAVARALLDGDGPERVSLARSLMADKDSDVRHLAERAVRCLTEDTLEAATSASLAFRFLAAQQGLGTDENVVISPPSLLTVLRLAQCGARGKTAVELNTWVGDGPPRPGEIAAWLERFPGDDQDAAFRWRMATAMFVQRGYAVDEGFGRELASLGGEACVEVDFRSPETGREMGEWVSRVTCGKLAPGPFPLEPRTRRSIVNGAYLSAKWMEPFTKGTRLGTFHRLDGSVIDTPMMHELVHAPAWSDRELQAVELIYQPGRTSMVVIVPREGYFERVRRGLCLGFWDELLASMSPTALSLDMPKFTVRARPPVKLWLERSGVRALFSAPDLSGISPAFVEGAFGELEHAAVLSVNEEGTEAAAYTAMYHIGSASTPMAIDRSFLFAIRDRQTGELLFAGQVLSPT